MQINTSVVNFRPPDTLGHNYLAGDVLHTLQQVSGGALTFHLAHIQEMLDLPDGWPQAWWDTRDQPVRADWHPSTYAAWLQRSGAWAKLAAGDVHLVVATADQRGGFAEFCIRGPGAGIDGNYGKTWGQVLPDLGRTYSIWGFNCQRDLASALHAVGHSVEERLRQRIPGVYKSWCGNDQMYADFKSSDPVPDAVWRGFAGVGSVHYPPFSRQCYEYDGPESEEWGSSHLGYMRRWLSAIPQQWWGLVLS